MIVVLLVEDSHVMRVSLHHYLTGEGVKVEYVTDAEEAMERLPAVRPDVLLLDHVLPGMDGLELLHELRRHECWRSLPAVILTAAADPTIREIEAQLPALLPCVLLRKPADPPEILRALREAKEHRHDAGGGMDER